MINLHQHFPGATPGVGFTAQAVENKKKMEETKMAREKMITRTIVETTARVMCLDVKSAEVTINEFKIGGEWSAKPSKLLERLQELYNTTTFKLVNIEDISEEEVLLGMSVEDFMRYAKVLPPRTKVNPEE